MTQFILTEVRDRVAVLTLNRPEMMNAWHRPMRQDIVAALHGFNADPGVGAIVLTGAGDKAFGAGQDLSEAKGFDSARASDWIGEWEELYNALRYLDKPAIAALNGLAAGSAFQFALCCDLRIGHPGIRMGQPEINAGIPSTTGPWAMMDKIGFARMVDLTLTGRLLGADECLQIGLLSRLVPQDQVMPAALALATELANKPPIAMRLNKQRFREMTEGSFQSALEAGKRIQAEAYGSGEPARMMEKFLARHKG